MRFRKHKPTEYLWYVELEPEDMECLKNITVRSIEYSGSNLHKDEKPIIGSISVIPRKARPGESIRIEIFNQYNKSYVETNEFTVLINGVNGALQYLQFPTKGEKNLFISVSKDNMIDTKNENVKIEGDALVFKTSEREEGVPKIPIMHSKQLYRNPYEVILYLGEAPIFELETYSPANIPYSPGNDRSSKTSDKKKFKYIWDFGDGTTKTTTAPAVFHNYLYAMDQFNEAKQFHVKCLIAAHGIEIVRTLTIHSAYVLCKRFGYIVPHIASTNDAVEKDSIINSRLIVYNVEDSPLIITDQAILPISAKKDDGSTPIFHKLENYIEIPPKSTTIISVYAYREIDLPRESNAFTMYYAGYKKVDGKGFRKMEVPVRISNTFYITQPGGGDGTGRLTWDIKEPLLTKKLFPWQLIVNPEAIADLKSTLNNNFPIKTSIDISTGTAAISIQHGLQTIGANINDLFNRFFDSVYSKINVENKKYGMQDIRDNEGIKQVRKTYAPLSGPSIHPPLSEDDSLPPAGPIEEGQICYPENIRKEDLLAAKNKQLVCTVVDDEEVRQICFHAKFANARKGDIVLSPGGSGIIGQLLRGLPKPQLYSHCGIMTNNFEEITHSTANEERINDKDFWEGTFLGYKGTDGIRPDIIKYLWPGVVTQSVEGAVYGENTWMDPEPGSCKARIISSFEPNPVKHEIEGRGLEITPPLVVHPDPLKETPKIRAKLHEVADRARSFGCTPDRKCQSHYNLYCYTDPTVASTTVGLEAGWAAGSFPSVCSSFIWKILKDLNIQLGSKGDSIKGQLQEGIGSQDGLYKYSKSERKIGAEWLYNFIYHKAYQDPDWYGELATNAADKWANQICNAFVIDDPRIRSDAWRSFIDDAFAISPENILFWASPDQNGLYGFPEPLRFQERRKRSYILSEWKKVIKYGRVEGTVTAEDHGIVSGAILNVGGNVAISDSNGSYSMDNIGLGKYFMHAYHPNVEEQQFEYNGLIDINSEINHIDIELKPPSEDCRLIDVEFEFFGLDLEMCGDEKYHELGGFSRNLSPSWLKDGKSIEFRWGGELRAVFDISFELLKDYSIRVDVIGRLYEGASENTDDEEDKEHWYFIAPKLNDKDKSNPSPFGCELNNEGFGGGDWAGLLLLVRNIRNVV